MIQQATDFYKEEVQYRLDSLGYRVTHLNRRINTSVMVNGSPKTGTTWMLMLVSSLPGVKNIGNFHRDISRYKKVMPGQVIHSHDPFSEKLWQILVDRQIRVVTLVRDPRDQAVSRMYHIRREKTHHWHTRLRDMSDGDALMGCIEGKEGLPGVREMVEITRSWLDSSQEVLSVRYEDLLQDPSTQFNRVLRFTGITASASLIDGIITRNRFRRLSKGRYFWRSGRKPGQEDTSSHFRKGIKGDWRNHFEEVHIGRFKEIAGDQLIELGYESDHNW